jgi:predicted peptidase
MLRVAEPDETTRRLHFRRKLEVPVSGDYFLQIPESSPDHGEPWPVVLFLHGMFGADTIFDIEAPPRIFAEGGLPAIVVSPTCAEARWPVDQLLGLLDEIESSLPVAHDRIYATGLSIGGLATWELALRAPDRLAAIVPICGAGQPWNAFRISHVPCWAFHGAEDDVVPLAETEAMIDALRAEGGSPKLTVYPGVGHDAWSRAYRDTRMWAWLLTQRKVSRGH